MILSAKFSVYKLSFWHLFSEETGDKTVAWVNRYRQLNRSLKYSQGKRNMHSALIFRCLNLIEYRVRLKDI